MLYLSEILALMMTIIAVIMGVAGAYIWIRGVHRRWRHEDEVWQNTQRRNLMDELDIQYEVGPDGFVRPIITERRHSH